MCHLLRSSCRFHHCHRADFGMQSACHPETMSDQSLPQDLLSNVSLLENSPVRSSRHPGDKYLHSRWLSRCMRAMCQIPDEARWPIGERNPTSTWEETASPP